MSFRDIENIRIEYRSLIDNVIEDFYIPVLTECVIYKRAVGYFSSNILSQITFGLSSMARRKAKIKLLISPKLSSEDYEAIKKGYELREIISNAIERDFEKDFDLETKDRLDLLAYLIEYGLLDLRVIFLQENNDIAMFHEKMGVLIDEEDNIVSFSGSANETLSGYRINYESIDVYCSWKSDESMLRCNSKDIAFNRLWDGDEKGTYVLKFPEVIKNKIMSFRKSDSSYIFNLDERFIAKMKESKRIGKEPSLNNIVLHDYQEMAIENWKNNDYRGIFDMATGTGKTFAGAGAIIKLLEDKKRAFVIIVCPYIHLIDQWKDELSKFNIKALACYGSKKDYEKDLSRTALRFKQKRSNFACILVTNGSFMSDTLQQNIKINLSDTALIVDEAHNFGADKISSFLNIDYPYRLALSATLERYMDEAGNKKLFDFFGTNKCITYSLEQAIREDKLVKYYYYPIIVSLNEDELDEYISLTMQIKKYANHNDEYEEMPDAYKMLLIKRARIIARTREKVVKLIDLLDGKIEFDGRVKNFTKENNMLVYCGAVKYGFYDSEGDTEDKKQIKFVIEQMHKTLGMTVSKFTAEEDSEAREGIKRAFTEENIQALVAIKCLDEGMNIPGIKTAFILASSTNPKEYIQRRGRVLRKYEGKKYAEIFDFVTLSRPLDDLLRLPYEAKELEISLVEKELSRVADFSRLAINSSYSNKITNEIKKAYNINIINEGRNDYE